MVLTKKNIHHYLLDKGYLNPQLFLYGDYTMEYQKYRNLTFKVYQRGGRDLFVKQLCNIGVDDIYAMQKEATVYSLIHCSSFYKNTKKFIPNLVGYDSNNHILVTELFPLSKSLRNIIEEEKCFLVDHAKKIAEILYSFHKPITRELKNNPSLKFFNQELPWIIKESESQFNRCNQQNPIIKIILSDNSFIEKLDFLRLNWKGTSLIHGDVKWSNFIFNQEKELKLIDWEIANIGDPLWDVGGVLQSYLSSWVFSYNDNNIKHQKFSEQEYISIPAIQKGIQAFWKFYVKLKDYSQKEELIALKVSTQMAGARLLQTALEANIQQFQMSPNIVRIIQLSQHLFNHPEQIIDELFGLTNHSYENASN